uniref:Cytochrome c oxidase subunit 3 n=1 Tax=Diplorchis hangzhouensis TaxID=1131906 RepID=A0A3G0WYR6_9PLAT|nr:cytochrome c oxidase subunit III [Diplorchis hangzhouensis]
MVSFFPVVCSFSLSFILLISFILYGVGLWSFILCFCLVVVGLAVLASLESSIWCYFEEFMTSSWYKTFVLGEFLLFLSLMMPIFYVNDDVGEEALSDPYGIPLLGVGVLLFSSFCVYNFECCVENCEVGFINSLSFDEISNKLLDGKIWLILTILNGVGFIFLQGVEFNICPASVINTSWYGTCLVLVTFHGFHVFVGLLFLSVVYFRLYGVDSLFVVSSFESYVYQFRLSYFTCFYWHFVDFIWFIVYFIVYFNP